MEKAWHDGQQQQAPLQAAQQGEQRQPFSTLFSLAGTVVVVTGGSRGLGYAAAEG
jgi:hypothetical protein